MQDAPHRLGNATANSNDAAQGTAPLSGGSSRLDDFVRAAADWTWETDRHLNYRHLSGGATKVFGVPAQKLLQGYVFSLSYFRKVDEDLLDLVKTMEAREPFRNRQARLEDSHGRARLLLLSGVPGYDDESGQFLGYRGTGLDITERPATEAAFPEVWNRLKELADLTADWRWESDATHKLASLSERYRDATGQAAEDALGQSFPDLWLGTGSARDKDLPREIATQQAFRNLHFEWDDPRTRRRHRMALSGLPKRDESGRFAGYLGVAVDLTCQLQQEETALAAKDNAEQASQAKSAFLASMSHQLRTPLNAIIGFSDSMRHEMLGSLGNPRYREYAEDIHASADHLLEIINEILDLSRIESGRAELAEDWLDIAETVDACRRMVAEQADAAGVTLTLELDPNLPRLRADGTRTRQILLNLVANAIKGTLRGGRVTVGTERAPSGVLRLTVRCEDKAASGMGPPAGDDGQKLLSPFGLLGADVNRGGTGLGISIAKSLVELHGGSLRLTSDAERGSEAIVEFPAERLEDAEERGGEWKILF